MRSIALSLHAWRGFGRAAQGDIFICSVRLGFMSLHVCRVCLVERLQQLKAVIEDVEGNANPEASARHWEGR